MSIDTCIDQCQQCHAEVSKAATRCLEAGAETPDPALVAALLDCAKITQATVDLLRRLPDLQGLAGRVCAEICERCVEACAASHDDAGLVDCARLCRACAEACRTLAAAGLTVPANPVAATTDEKVEEAEEDDAAAIDNFGFIETSMAELVSTGPAG